MSAACRCAHSPRRQTVMASWIAVSQFGLCLALADTAAAYGAPGGPIAGTITRAVKATTVDMSNTIVATPNASLPPRRLALNRTSSLPAGRPASLVPRTSSSQLAGPGPLTANFNAASSRDSARVNGFDLEPPDQGQCAGAGEVVEPINLTLSVYATTGAKTTGPVALSNVFGEPTRGGSAEYLTDPSCTFDPASRDFFLTVAAIDGFGSGPGSHLDIGVMTAGTTSVTTFRVDTADSTGSGCPCFGDQPRLGLDAANVYVASNEFPISGPNYDGAQIFAVSRSQLAAGAPAPYVAVFRHLAVSGLPVLSLEPAVTTGNAAAEYFAHSFVVGAAGNYLLSDNRIGVWAMTNEAAVSAGQLPTLSSPAVVAVHRYMQPIGAVNPNGYLLNADDDRLQQVQYTAGKVWAALDTTAVVSGTNTNHDGLAWMELSPSVSSAGQVAVTVTAQGLLAAAGTDLLYPDVAAAPNGTTAIVFSLTSQTLNPSVGYSVRLSGQKQFSTVQVAATGTGPDNGFTCGQASTCRWGDYSAAAVDGSTGRIWMAGEYIPPRSSQSSSLNGVTNWGTRIFALG